MILNGTPKWTTWTKMQPNAFLCFALSNVLVLINLSWSLCIRVTFVPCSNILMLFGIRVSLPIRPTNLKEFKKGLWELFLVLIIFHMLMLWMYVMLIVYLPGGSNIVWSLRNPFLNVAGLVSCSLLAQARYMVGNWGTMPNSPSLVLALIDMLVVQSHIMWSYSTANSHNWTSCFLFSSLLACFTVWPCFSVVYCCTFCFVSGHTVCFFLLSYIVHCNSALGPRFCANKIISLISLISLLFNISRKVLLISLLIKRDIHTDMKVDGNLIKKKHISFPYCDYWYSKAFHYWCFYGNQINLYYRHSNIAINIIIGSFNPNYKLWLSD